VEVASGERPLWGLDWKLSGTRSPSHGPMEEEGRVNVIRVIGGLAFVVLASVGSNSLFGSADAAADRYGELPVAWRFDYPVGRPDAEGFYNAQGFGENFHLGEDWNIVGSAREDLGAPVHSVADGVVSAAVDMKGGWGNVVRVVHHIRENRRSFWVESYYAHLDEIHVEVGDAVRRGTTLGTIGDAHGVYLPHLHFEMRSAPDLPFGPGYSTVSDGYLDPSAFIDAHR